MEKYPLRTYFKNKPHSPCIEYIHPIFQRAVQTVIDFAESEENTFFDKIILAETNLTWEWDCKIKSNYRANLRLVVVYHKKMEYGGGDFDRETYDAINRNRTLLSMYFWDHMNKYTKFRNPEIDIIDYDKKGSPYFDEEYLYYRIIQDIDERGTVLYERPGGRLCGN